MTDYTERARALILDIGLDADWADHEVTALVALLNTVAAEAREEQREEDARVCSEREGWHLDAMEGADADVFTENAIAATEAGNCAAAIRAGCHDE